MDIKTTLWTLALCAGLTLWLYCDVKSMHINYDWHSYLVDPQTGAKLKPREVLDLGKIINYTEDYINKTNALERLYDLQFNANLENPYTLDQSYSNPHDLKVSGWPVADQRECSAQLNWIHEQLNNSGNKSYQLIRGARGLELTRMLDSFGRPESGLYTGTLTWVGSHKRCLASQLDGGRIRMRYCQARLRPKWWPERENVHPKSRIKMGICLPETCDSNSFQFASQRQAIDALIRLDLPEFFKQNLQFESMFCLPDERSPIRQISAAGYNYLLMVSVWLTLVITASILYEVRKYNARQRIKNYELAIGGGGGGGEQSCVLSFKRVDGGSSNQLEVEQTIKMKLLEALSVHNSLKSFKSDLFHEQQERQRHEQQVRVRVDLGPLSFIKFWLAILVVFSHGCYLTSVYTRSIGNRIDININGFGKMALSFGRCVDTFFMFFGLLTAYTLLRKFSIRQLANPLTWITVNLGIMLRITPLFMLVYWYSRLVSPYTGYGPWWDYGVYRYSMKGNCLNEPWWKSIPYFGSTGSPPVATCILPAWFLVSYSQLSLIMPLLTYLIVKLPSHLTRYLLLAFVATISCAQFALKMQRQVSIKEEAFTLYGSFLPDLMEKFESTGAMATIGRASCVSIGCYAGYLLRMYEIGQIKQWPRWLTNKLLLFGSMAMHLIVVFLPLIGDRLSRLSTPNGQQHIATMNEFLSSYLVTMTIWPLINTIVTINAVTIYNRVAVVRFLSHPVWHTANKLGLAIYLIHWEVIFIGVTGHEHAPSMGFLTDMMKMWAFGVFYTIMLAFLIFILFEAPLSALLKLIVDYIQAQLITNKIRSSEDEELDEKSPNSSIEVDKREHV